jgi:hypothetical protein
VWAVRPDELVATARGANKYSFTQREIRRRLPPDPPLIPVWAYDDGWPGDQGPGLTRLGPWRQPVGPDRI